MKFASTKQHSNMPTLLSYYRDNLLLAIIDNQFECDNQADALENSGSSLII